MKIIFSKLKIFILISIATLSCSKPSIPLTETNPTVDLSPIPNTPTVIIPIPSDAESKEVALNLLKNNGDCDLPCIWGLTPGITTSVERQKILVSYGEFSDSDFSMSGSGADLSKNPGGFGIGITNEQTRIFIGLSYYETENLIEILTLVSGAQQDQKYVYGNISYSGLLEYYTLPQLLSNYGVPSNVLVHALPYDVFSKADYEPFSIVVIYSDLGIMAEYISPTEWIGEMVELPTPGLSVGEIARGCPSQSRIILRTWDVKKNIPIKKIASIAAGEGISGTAYDYFLPIQDATFMSVDDFYNTFKEPNNEQCIELSSRFWMP